MKEETKQERKFDEARLIYLWEKGSYKELREYVLSLIQKIEKLYTPKEEPKEEYTKKESKFECGELTVDSFGGNKHKCPITKPCWKHDNDKKL